MTGAAEKLVFRVGPELFAVPIEEVEEAMDLDGVHPVAGARGALLGVFPYRGALVPLYTVANALNVQAGSLGTALLVRRGDGERLALAVDDVLDAVVIDASQLRPLAGSAGADRVVTGVARVGAELIAVVDLHALVAASRGGADQESQ
jgi:chemotaxis signal transduction protein